MPYALSTVTHAATTMALCTLAAAKDELGISATNTSQDGILGQQILQVSAAIHAYCGRIFVRQGYRDTFRDAFRAASGPLITRQSPIAADVPVIVSEGGSALGASSYEVHLETGSIYRLDAGWGGSLVVVQYDGGYDLIPDDIQAACLQWLTSRHNVSGRDPSLRSQNIPDVVSETYWVQAEGAVSTAVPSTVQELLRPYIPWSI